MILYLREIEMKYFVGSAIAKKTRFIENKNISRNSFHGPCLQKSSLKEKTKMNSTNEGKTCFISVLIIVVLLNDENY